MAIAHQHTSPFDAKWHLRAEMARLTVSLARLLQAQRERGRTPATDAVRGLAIEGGEAEGLLAALASRWREPSEAKNEREGWTGSDPEIFEMRRLADQAEAQGAYLPLRRAARAFRLSEPEYGALLLALAVEIDPRFGRLVAYLNDHVSQTSPTVGLAFAMAAAEASAPPEIPLTLPERPAFRDGLIELSDAGPLPGRSLALGAEIAARLSGDAEAELPSRDYKLWLPEAGMLDRLVLTDTMRSQVVSLVEGVRRTPEGGAAVLLVGADGSGRSSVARAIASELGLPLVAIDGAQNSLDACLRTLRRECRWRGAVPLLTSQQSLAPEEWERIWRDAPEGAATRLVALNSAQLPAVRETLPKRAVELSLGEPDRNQRAELWRQLLPGGRRLAADDLDRLASSFAFLPGMILQAVRKAESDVALRPDGERRFDFALLSRACREVGAARMGSLAQRLQLSFRLEDLVVPKEVHEELQLALAWVRHERKVLDEWGLARRTPYGHGLTAMFCGPSGTGKTMAAQVLAHELELDLYRIDLSQVMSKFIGETERNLAQLFDQAHASGAVLFFDEADAIFGKRTEVKDAHDRYANVEIGYLLQRMEEHDGVTLLATNRRQDLDEAFVRRFHVIVNFPMPSKESRLLIWRGMFPDEMEREPELDLQSLADGFEISGGEIRNCVLAAGYLAASEERAVGMAHLKRALRRELRKSGRFADERAILELS